MNVRAWFQKWRAAPSVEPEAAVEGAEPTTIAGERGGPYVNKPRSPQELVTRLATLAVLAAVMAGFFWFHAERTVNLMAQSALNERAQTRAKATGDPGVPPIGAVAPPAFAAAAPKDVSEDEAAALDADAAVDPDAEVEADEPSEDWRRLLGEKPPAPNWRDHAPAQDPEPSVSAVPGGSGATEVTPEPPGDRRLQGTVFASSSSALGSSGVSAAPLATHDTRGASERESRAELSFSRSVVRATRLPTQRGWLPKGTFLDATLQTAIDSTLPGLTIAVLAHDTYGADGQALLLARGTRLLGEVRSRVARGQRRLQVEWQEARTPEGVVIELTSPGTDALGRAGLTGDVDRHFGERFGAALLVSVLDGVVQAGVAKAREGGDSTIVVTPAGAQDIASEVLKDTIAIPTTIRVAPGTQLQVLVAQDVDFRGVMADELHGAR